MSEERHGGAPEVPELPHLVGNVLRRTAIGAKRMRRQFRRARGSAHVHTAPGTIAVPPGELPPVVTVTAFGPDRIEERTITRLEEIDALGQDWPVTWLNIDGLGDAALLRAVAERFRIHPLAMEDATDTSQRAKAEAYGDATFLVLPMPHEDEKGFWTEQIAIWVTDRVVVTIQSMPGDCLDPLRHRLREPGSRARHCGAPYLSYAIADSVVDAYFPVVDRIGADLDPLEDEAFSRPDGRTLARIRRIRAELVRVRRAIHPVRDAAIAMTGFERLYDQETRHYLRDLNDHVSRVLDQVETDRFMANDLLDIYMTSVNLKVAETSKVLAIIATLFLPLSFIAGVYGMNFGSMPGLDSPWGFWTAIGVMAATAVGMMLYFARKGWLKDSTKS